jgi:hypothetical protein
VKARAALGGRRLVAAVFTSAVCLVHKPCAQAMQGLQAGATGTAGAWLPPSWLLPS